MHPVEGRLHRVLAIVQVFHLAALLRVVGQTSNELQLLPAEFENSVRFRELHSIEIPFCIEIDAERLVHHFGHRSSCDDLNLGRSNSNEQWEQREKEKLGFHESRQYVA